MSRLTLREWQDRLARAQSEWESERARMDRREALYRGARKIRPIVADDEKRETVHVRNLIMEMIESQVDTNLPSPKVTPRREQDEDKAKIIEDMLRNELDRLPMEEINDRLSRTVPIQGGAAFLLEWDDTITTPRTVGELVVSAIHPKQLIPQDGVTSGVEDMDYIILAQPQTKEYIRRRYGKTLEHESEEEPEIRGADGESTADDLVTQYVAYYRNDNGGIGLYSWVQNTELEDLPDYQARRIRRCATCGASEQHGEDMTAIPESMLGRHEGPEPVTVESRRDETKLCPHCGGHEWTEVEEDYEEIYLPISRSDGTQIPGASLVPEESGEVDMFGVPLITTKLEPTRVPFYKPDIYPVVIIRNVSQYGKLLGGSDVDAIEDQQNTTNRVSAKIIDKLMSSGSYMTLPEDCSFEVSPKDIKVIRPSNAATAQMIHVYDMEGNVSQDMEYLAQVYEEARQIIGITDSFQGRKDSTATSGKAKEFSAAQSAGRLESKRVMKNAAWAQLFEAMFKFKLAYTDEPRPVPGTDANGDRTYAMFNRYDFLEQDETGAWWWNDLFLFSCDTSAPLANNREAMWQEARMNLQTGAFGDPAALETLIIFWKRMEQLHYPGAGDTRQVLEERLQQQLMQQQMMMQQQQMAQQQAALNGVSEAQLREGVLPNIPAADNPVQFPQRAAETRTSEAVMPQPK